MGINKIADKAEELADDQVIMNSYRDFFNMKGYYLTKNIGLEKKAYGNGSNIKPSKFPTQAVFLETWNDKYKFTRTQKRYILYLAGGLNDREVNIQKYDTIKRGYERWPDGYYVIYYSADAKWACNLFVGETLFRAGYKQMNGDKYYSAKQIWNGEGGFKIVAKKDVARGDIVAFGGHHVEIVTKVNRGQRFNDDDFCARGAGRGSSDFGTEKCESIFGSSREIDNDDIRFFTIR
jgi:hypothetical protein